MHPGEEEKEQDAVQVRSSISPSPLRLAVHVTLLPLHASGGVQPHFPCTTSEAVKCLNYCCFVKFHLLIQKASHFRTFFPSPKSDCCHSLITNRIRQDASGSETPTNRTLPHRAQEEETPPGLACHTSLQRRLTLQLSQKMSSPAPTAASSSRRPLPSTASHLHPQTHTRRRAQNRSGTATPTTGSATQTITNTTPRSSESPEPPLVLRLRGVHGRAATRTEVDGEPEESESSRRAIRWADDVVDNEGLGRKSSKVCCIYHRPRAVGESDSESDSSDSDSDAGESPDDGSARPVGGRRGRGCGHDHDHGHGHDSRTGKGKRKPSPNAYERLPKHMREHQKS